MNPLAKYYNRYGACLAQQGKGKTEIIERTCCYGVFQEKDKYLFVKTAFADVYEFPGGGINPGESPVDALVREFKEETGMMITDMEMKPNLEFMSYFFSEDLPNLYHTRMLFFDIKSISGEQLLQIDKNEIVDIRFIARDVLKNHMRSFNFHHHGAINLVLQREKVPEIKKLVKQQRNTLTM